MRREREGCPLAKTFLIPFLEEKLHEIDAKPIRCPQRRSKQHFRRESTRSLIGRRVLPVELRTFAEA